MKTTLFLKFAYILLCTITFISFGTYTIFGNLKYKTAITVNDFTDEKQEDVKETAKELTESFLVENFMVVKLNLKLITSEKYLVSSLIFNSFGAEPSTPPPDLT